MMMIPEEKKDTLRREAGRWPQDGRLEFAEDCTAYLWRETRTGDFCDVLEDGGRCIGCSVTIRRRRPGSVRSRKNRRLFLRAFKAVACAWRRTESGVPLLPESKGEVFLVEGRKYVRLGDGSYERFDEKRSGTWVDPEENR